MIQRIKETYRVLLENLKVTFFSQLLFFIQKAKGWANCQSLKISNGGVCSRDTHVTIIHIYSLFPSLAIPTKQPEALQNIQEILRAKLLST